MCSGSSIPGKSTVFNGNKGISIVMMFLFPLLSAPLSRRLDAGSVVGGCLASIARQETPATRGTDRQNISNLYVKGGLSRKLGERSIPLKRIDAYCSISAAMQAIRGSFTSIGE
jgi:hypothetical protein